MAADEHCSFKITNFKISVKIQPISLDEIEKLCKESNFEYKRRNNFIIFTIKDKESDDFVYTIFKGKSVRLRKRENTKTKYFLKKQSEYKLQHCNITKIRPQQIEHSIVCLLKFLKYQCEKLDYTIDNITANGKLNHKINLKKLLLLKNDSNSYSYNPEKFPGLKLRRSKEGQKLTYLIFTSGSVVILGGKSEAQIKSDICWISKNAPPLCTNKFLLPRKLCPL